MIVTPTPTGFLAGGRATLIGDDDEDTVLRAWAERHVRVDPDLKWIVGNYVEADNPNSNGHIFPLDELSASYPSLVNKPLNMLHREQHIVGSFVGAQLVDAAGNEFAAEPHAMATAKSAMNHPYVEAVAGIWHGRFPEEYDDIRRAHKEGNLYFSMEAIPQRVSCPTCKTEAAFAGFESEAYCAHMQGATGPKRLHKPVFAGGAIIIPPVRPGWDNADIRAIASQNADAAGEPAEDPSLAGWEWIMALIQALSVGEPADQVAGRKFSTPGRQKLADKGHAMPDGSFPISTVEDLQNAIQAVGRAKNPAAAKAHIRKRARALGRTDLIPPDWD